MESDSSSPKAIVGGIPACSEEASVCSIIDSEINILTFFNIFYK
jgi:hypothetical protein